MLYVDIAIIQSPYGPTSEQDKSLEIWWNLNAFVISFHMINETFKEKRWNKYKFHKLNNIFWDRATLHRRFEFNLVQISNSEAFFCGVTAIAFESDSFYIKTQTSLFRIKVPQLLVQYPRCNKNCITMTD